MSHAPARTVRLTASCVCLGLVAAALSVSASTTPEPWIAWEASPELDVAPEALSQQVASGVLMGTPNVVVAARAASEGRGNPETGVELFGYRVEDGRLSWRRSLDSRVDTGSTLLLPLGQHAFATTPGSRFGFIARSNHTGRRLWRTPLVGGATQVGISTDGLLIGAGVDRRGRLLIRAFHSDTGHVAWQRRRVGGPGRVRAGGLLAAEDTLLIVSYRTSPEGESFHEQLALDRTSGQIRWSVVEPSNGAVSVDGRDTGHVTDGVRLYSLAHRASPGGFVVTARYAGTGARAWEFARARNPRFSYSPYGIVTDGDTVYAFGAWRNRRLPRPSWPHVSAFDAESGRLLWDRTIRRHGASAFEVGLAHPGEIVLSGQFEDAAGHGILELRSYEARTGRMRWRLADTTSSNRLALMAEQDERIVGAGYSAQDREARVLVRMLEMR